jgi:hypothetical protein
MCCPRAVSPTRSGDTDSSIAAKRHVTICSCSFERYMLFALQVHMRSSYSCRTYHFLQPLGLHTQLVH